METVRKSIDVNVPLRTVYNQWTQFEEFPLFMEGVKEVRQIDDRHLFWRAEIAGKEVEWDAEIAEQIPDKKITWHSTFGAQNAGAVSFKPVDENTTRVELQLGYDPKGLAQNAGDALGLVTRRIAGDLKRFKEFIENRGRETGAWRGTVGSQWEMDAVRVTTGGEGHSEVF